MFAQMATNPRASRSRFMSTPESELDRLWRGKLGGIPARARNELIERRLSLILNIDEARLARELR
jgi:hypothetical protein